MSVEPTMVPGADILQAMDSMPCDAQGRTCWLDDKVWHDGRWRRVVAISHKGKVCIRRWERTDGRGGRWVDASEVAHERPDTQEIIDRDAMWSHIGYWRCAGDCAACPAMVDGKRPFERYGTAQCLAAQHLDLLRRQRELDKAEVV